MTTMIAPATRVCNDCGKEKPDTPEHFQRDCGRIRTICRQCVNESRQLSFTRIGYEMPTASAKRIRFLQKRYAKAERDFNKLTGMSATRADNNFVDRVLKANGYRHTTSTEFNAEYAELSGRGDLR
jgi:hypothetical protein